MSEFFLELFSEEIPARMQRAAAAALERLTYEVLAPLAPSLIETFYGPRRIALKADVRPEVPASCRVERGPRVGSSSQAVNGFLRKHGAATLDDLRQDGDYWVLEKTTEATPATSLIAEAIPSLLRRFPWPRSMRWGGTSAFTWVRPLRRIICLLDRDVVAFDLRHGSDDGHGLIASNQTEGHRFHAPGVFTVSSCADWQQRLRDHHVIADAAARKRVIAEGIGRLAVEHQLQVVEDADLLDEVAGLVEWPVPLLGRIDAAFMDLPAEVMQVSMRVNQRYFALHNPDGSAAPYFACVANIEPADGGAVTVAGNERVLRARFADARHFWDLDRKTRLANWLPQLDHITFHARLGTQGDRTRRLEALAQHIAPLVNAGPALARQAARLSKADLVTGMVGEFPELQGVMGRYYALHDGEDPLVADAIRDHYAPRGPADAVPAAPVSVAVALADKLDQLAGFFAIGEKPTGAGDPYALRRAGLGMIRIIRENRLRLHLRPLIEAAGQAFMHHHGVHPASPEEMLDFLAERLRVQLRSEGARHDVLAAVFAAGADDDLNRLLARADAVTALLGSPDGPNLLIAYRRAANILRIESRKDGPHTALPDDTLLRERAEIALNHSLVVVESVAAKLAREDFGGAMTDLARLRAPLDAFFDKVTVNTPEPELRRNRLRLLHRVQAAMDRVADFSRLEG